MSNYLFIVLAIASAIDYIIGDPWGWPHPVRAMGWVISKFSQFILKHFSSKWLLRLAGIFLAVGLITSCGLLTWLLVQACRSVHPLLAIMLNSILVASCFAARSLRSAAEDVLQPLISGDLVTARCKLRLYVGRDTQNLSEPEMLRAVLETVAENATDGVMAPLFYAIAGLGLSVASNSAIDLVAVLPIAYKAASTLDSMVGYREAPYTDLGWCSAKLEDLLTWLPCRLTVITLALLSRKPLYVWQLCQRDAILDPSPNSGWSECAYAAILGVQLGGVNWYGGIAKEKPLLGENLQTIAPEAVTKALSLTRICFLLWLGIAIAIFAIPAASGLDWFLQVSKLWFIS